MGYRMGIYPSQAHRAAIRAMTEVLEALKDDGDLTGWEDRLASFQDREAAVDTPRWRNLEAKYLAVE